VTESLVKHGEHSLAPEVRDGDEGAARGRVFLAVPLVLVNAAAVWGQAGWALTNITHGGIFGLIVAVLFALAVESIGVYLAFESHLALMADQAAGLLRVGSYAVGALAGALNFLHFREQSLATGIVFGALSAVSPWLWAIYSRARNRVRLAELDLVDQRGVKLSTSRKLWHPVRSMRVISWAAWEGETNPRAAVEGWERSRWDQAPGPTERPLSAVSEQLSVVPGHAPAGVLDQSDSPELLAEVAHLAGLPTDAERIRWALDQLDTEDTGIIVRHLAERDSLVSTENVRAVLRRGRPRPNNRVAQLGHRSMQASSRAGEQASRGVGEHAST